MNKEEIPTALEFSKKYNAGLKTHEEMANGYIEFARLQVQAALKEASEKAEAVYTGDRKHPIVNKESILNSYPIENIK